MILHKYFSFMSQNKLVPSLCVRESLKGTLLNKVATGKMADGLSYLILSSETTN